MKVGVFFTIVLSTFFSSKKPFIFLFSWKQLKMFLWCYTSNWMGRGICVWSKVRNWFPCQIIFFRTKEFVHSDVKVFHTKPREEGVITPEPFYGELEWILWECRKISIRMVSDILYSIATHWVSLSISFLWKDVSKCIDDKKEFHPRLQFWEWSFRWVYTSSYYYRNLEEWNKYCNKVVADGGKNLKLPKDEHISLKSMEMYVGLSLSLCLSSSPHCSRENFVSDIFFVNFHKKQFAAGNI